MRPMSLKMQANNKAQPKEMAQLASRECLHAFKVGSSDRYSPLSAALDYAVDPTTRAWWMRRLNQLQALGCWRFLPWDSQVLGCPSGSVGGLWAEGDYAVQRHRLETVLKACIMDAEARGVQFLSVRLPEDGLASLHAVEAVGFRIIESFLTFSLKIPTLSGRTTDEEIPLDLGGGKVGRAAESKSSRLSVPSFHVRLAQPDEMETVASIAYRAFESFRLRVDPQIPESRARHSRREWVRNGFKGRAEAIYVAESENRLRSESPGPVGFALLRSKVDQRTEKVGEIELIAVDPAFHGRGIGKALVAQAIRHYQGTVSAIHVGTQAKNLRAVGLYTRMGFSVIRSEFSFHRHTETIA